MRPLPTLLLCCLCASTVIAGDFRTWTDATGNHKTEAEFVRVESGVVSLMKRDGDVIEVPMERLSKLDQAEARYAAIPEDSRPSLGADIVMTEAMLDAVEEANAPKPPVTIGVWLVRVYVDGPCDKADLKFGDILYRCGATTFRDYADYLNWLCTLKVGEDYNVEGTRLIESRRSSKWNRSKVSITPMSYAQVSELESRCPLQLVDVSISHNSIGVPEVRITVKNVSRFAVVAFEAEIHCLTRFDEPVIGSFRESNVVPGISQKTIKSGTHSTSVYTLNLHETTAKAKVVLKRVKLDSGSEWTPEDGEEESLAGGTGR